MTYFEAIKEMDENTLARFIMALDMCTDAIPKRYACNETWCKNCKEDLSCYKAYLNQEVSIEIYSDTYNPETIRIIEIIKGDIKHDQKESEE